MRIAKLIHFTALMELLCGPEWLHESFDRRAGNKATGIDGMHKADYALDLDAQLESTNKCDRVPTALVPPGKFTSPRPMAKYARRDRLEGKRPTAPPTLNHFTAANSLAPTQRKESRPPASD